jgi:enamine deaminase RidA (YjgF/YER057c/UK114 family)
MQLRTILSRNKQKKKTGLELEVSTKKSLSSFLLKFFFTPDNKVASNTVGVNLLPLTEYDSEYWLADGDLTQTFFGNVRIISSENFSFFVSTTPNVTDTESSARAAYLELFEALKRKGYESPVRAWNYIPHILQNENQYDSSYESFNAGRLEAWLKAGPRNQEGAPLTCSATGIGTYGDKLTIIFLASKYPCINIENPRQESTINYPEQYGTKPPIFSRATILNFPNKKRIMLLSGTGSIVGSKTVHPNDPKNQIREVIKNIETLISKENLKHYNQDEFRLKDALSLRIYVKSTNSVNAIQDVVNRYFGRQPDRLLLESEFCRNDLEVEIEAVIGG